MPCWMGIAVNAYMVGAQAVVGHPLAVVVVVEGGEEMGVADAHAAMLPRLE